MATLFIITIYLLLIFFNVLGNDWLNIIQVYYSVK